MRNPRTQARNGERMRRVAILGIGLAALAAGLAGTARAGSDERKGTGGALELRLPVGPRGSALGSSAVADPQGIESAFWNPAGLGMLDHPEVMFTHTNYIADMNLNYAAVGTKVGDFGTLALHAKVLSVGDVIVTTESSPDGTGDIIRPTFTTLGVSWGRKFTDRVLFGATLNYLDERIFNESARGVAVDLGVQYLTGWRGLKFGVAMKNFGPSMSFGGEDLEAAFQPPDADPTAQKRTFMSTSSSFELPSYFVLGASCDLFSSNGSRVAALAAFQNNNFVGDTFNGGLEYSYRDVFSLRGSYFASVQSQADFTSGQSSSIVHSGDDLFSGLALGGGVRFSVGRDSRVSLDAVWHPVRQFFDDTLEIGLKLGL